MHNNIVISHLQGNDGSVVDPLNMWTDCRAPVPTLYWTCWPAHNHIIVNNISRKYAYIQFQQADVVRFSQVVLHKTSHASFILNPFGWVRRSMIHLHNCCGLCLRQREQILFVTSPTTPILTWRLCPKALNTSSFSSSVSNKDGSFCGSGWLIITGNFFG